MGSFHENMTEYKKQLEKGTIQAAYKGLMEYLRRLRTYLYNKYPDHNVSGIYYGYMDMTYFSFIPKSLKNEKLKIAIVFLHETFQFEVWLAGFNKQVQQEYWKLLKEGNWSKYPLVPTTRGMDSIIEHVLVADPNFSDLNALTDGIERETLIFIRDVEGFLSAQ
ncbi:MAG: hypothetical protein ABIJ65_13160 [Chloroflexota bacterium]